MRRPRSRALVGLGSSDNQSFWGALGSIFADTSSKDTSYDTTLEDQLLAPVRQWLQKAASQLASAKPAWNHAFATKSGWLVAQQWVSATVYSYQQAHKAAQQVLSMAAPAVYPVENQVKGAQDLARDYDAEALEKLQALGSILAALSAELAKPQPHFSMAPPTYHLANGGSSFALAGPAQGMRQGGFGILEVQSAGVYWTPQSTTPLLESVLCSQIATIVASVGGNTKLRVKKYWKQGAQWVYWQTGKEFTAAQGLIQCQSKG